MMETQGIEEFVQELEEFQARIDQFPDQATDRLETVLRQGLMLLAAYAADYPPKPADSSYRRTGTLGRGWTAATPQVTVSGHVLGARITNAIPYGPEVQGPGQQLPVHRGRWEPTDEIMSNHVGEVHSLLVTEGYELVEGLANV
jgi:hypothetical protein